MRLLPIDESFFDFLDDLGTQLSASARLLLDVALIDAAEKLGPLRIVINCAGTDKHFISDIFIVPLVKVDISYGLYKIQRGIL